MEWLGSLARARRDFRTLRRNVQQCQARQAHEGTGVEVGQGIVIETAMQAREGFVAVVGES